MHHPWRRNVTTSMVRLKMVTYAIISPTVVNPRDTAGECRRRRRRRLHPGVWKLPGCTTSSVVFKSSGSSEHCTRFSCFQENKICSTYFAAWCLFLLSLVSDMLFCVHIKIHAPLLFLWVMHSRKASKVWLQAVIFVGSQMTKNKQINKKYKDTPKIRPPSTI